MDARLKVSVARQGARARQIRGFYGLRDFRVYGAGVAYARRAAVAGEVEAERIEVLLQSGGFEVVGHHARARRERRLYIGGRAQAELVRLFRQQPRRDENRRVRGIRAAGYRRYQDAAVAQFALGGFGFGVGVGADFGHEIPEGLLGFREVDFVLRALGAGDGRADFREVEVYDFRVVALAVGGDSENTLRFVVIAREGDELFVAPRQPQVFERRFVYWEVAHCRPVFGRHVRDCRAVGERKAPRALPEKFHEFADDFFAAQHLRDVQGEVG